MALANSCCKMKTLLERIHWEVSGVYRKVLLLTLGLRLAASIPSVGSNWDLGGTRPMICVLQRLDSRLSPPFYEPALHLLLPVHSRSGDGSGVRKPAQGCFPGDRENWSSLVTLVALGTGRGRDLIAGLKLMQSEAIVSRCSNCPKSGQLNHFFTAVFC